MDGLKVITAREAYDFMKAEPSAVLIDIRSNMEYLFVGHAKGASHIAWIDEPEWEINPNFVAEVRQLLLGGVSCPAGSGCAKIMLICRSGNRSMEAGTVLVEAGLKNIYSVEAGFEGDADDQHHRSALNGWRFDGLPWEQC